MVRSLADILSTTDDAVVMVRRIVERKRKKRGGNQFPEKFPKKLLSVFHAHATVQAYVPHANVQLGSGWHHGSLLLTGPVVKQLYFQCVLIFENPETGIYEVDPRVYHVSLYDIMNVVDEPDLFVCTLFDFMKILYFETPTERGMCTLFESVSDPLGVFTTEEMTRHFEIYVDHEVVVKDREGKQEETHTGHLEVDDYYDSTEGVSNR